MSKAEEFARVWKEIDGELLIEPKDRRAYKVVIGSLIVGPHPKKIANLIGESYWYVHGAAKTLTSTPCRRCGPTPSTAKPSTRCSPPTC